MANSVLVHAVHVGVGASSEVVNLFVFIVIKIERGGRRFVACCL